MSLSDNLRRLARERIPTGPAKWLGPITPVKTYVRPNLPNAISDICAVCQLLRRTSKSPRMVRKLRCGSRPQTAKCDEKLGTVSFFTDPVRRSTRGPVGAATTKRLTAHGVRKFCRRSHITKNKGEPNGTCADQ